MSAVFPIEPPEGWAAGDLAYCVNPRNAPCRPRLEAGRVYEVAKAWKPDNIVSHGLALRGIETGDYAGFWSNRFVRLGPLGGRLAALDAATQRTMGHYRRV